VYDEDFGEKIVAKQTIFMTKSSGEKIFIPQRARRKLKEQ